ncbi:MULTISPECIES: hypothetical protein [unclassified Psychrobacter]|uniref:hypothetical protein n=1 Tax=unclassified Psychrobacter TaxID=196806 RepID=UPI0025DE5A84|nr:MULTISPECIES: hypothetical protein [unclassified Psychrobacter]
MSQIFNLCLAADTLAADAQKLGVTIDTLQSIQVEVTTTLLQTAQITQTAQQSEWQLQLSYRIMLPIKTLAAQLNWLTWQTSNVGFVDYLWEQTCLECFLAGSLITSAVSIHSADVDKTAPYIEINASPDGRYALYQFANYRSPATLPPTPLLQTNGQTRASINWIANRENASTEQKSSLMLVGPFKNFFAPRTAAANTYHYERRFNLSLSQLSHTKTDIDNNVIDYIHPCVILSFTTTFGTTALYFAPKHASPPDFHNQHYWSLFDKQAAMIKPFYSS